ncbi:MAG: formamidopyrimidine-DNA glycosylase [Deltaproteobacteria bacterium HGW-Deltaproteobacteria-10]|nr:MAG: formamidopyrimidine-DNA glycosylase [Deltaproteobacteria bacterium HGW-Deltaproteobacteria-10]
MPELPEVETLCRQLQKKIDAKKITASEVYDSKLSHIKGIKGKTIVAVRRNGKTIEIILDDGHSVLIHLRMTGRLLWQEAADRPLHSRWHLSLGKDNLYLVDPRRFATINVLPTEDTPGSNDIMNSFDRQSFITKHSKRKTKVKNLIMDQKAIHGIGNIYACEILFAAGIHPTKMAATLTNKDWQRIFGKAKLILKKAIEKRGTSISDWRDLYGLKGENQFDLKAYGREGKPCLKCGNKIVRIKQGGRSTFYCPICQQ